MPPLLLLNSEGEYIMTAAEYMRQVQSCNRMIENALEDIAFYKNKAVSMGIQYDNTKVKISLGSDRMGAAVASYVSLEDELAETIQKAKAIRCEVIRTIEQLKADEYDVLHKYYVQGLTIYEIADRCEKSCSWARQTKSRALKNLQIILDKR